MYVYIYIWMVVYEIIPIASVIIVQDSLHVLIQVRLVFIPGKR